MPRWALDAVRADGARAGVLRGLPDQRRHEAVRAATGLHGGSLVGESGASVSAHYRAACSAATSRSAATTSCRSACGSVTHCPASLAGCCRSCWVRSWSSGSATSHGAATTSSHQPSAAATSAWAHPTPDARAAARASHTPTRAYSPAAHAGNGVLGTASARASRRPLDSVPG